MEEMSDFRSISGTAAKNNAKHLMGDRNTIFSAGLALEHRSNSQEIATHHNLAISK